MDFLGNQCPVCKKYFHADDDIVVCPECGTPHHRECYEAIGHCANEQRHAEDYDYAEDDENVNSNVVICRSCGKENEKDAFFCKYCAAPLSKEDQVHGSGASPAGNPGQQMNGGFAYPFMDPMAGVPGDTDMGDDVTAGEIAKYVKQNTPYFVRVFNNIKSFNRSRFSFVGAIFGGGYLLYRKMYKIGTLLTLLQAAMMIISAVVQRSAVYTDFWNRYTALSVSGLLDYTSQLEGGDRFIFLLPFIISAVNLVMHIVIGAVVNRLYFKHCRLQIVKIKATAGEKENPDILLQTKGGVNMPLAVSLLAANIIITYLPGMF